ncbi:hypothetical protein [Actinokineospora spheciospongiae]|uniref:hypothetical protein n=1 Tax=Actinokineospora spheciospongiae TaxID=909613 RepID=UPI0004ADF09F|nr:hypothetical protein [Actinokineospora spheciospongiae]
MTWQDDLRKLDEALTKDAVTLAEYRKRRDEILIAASTSPAPAQSKRPTAVGSTRTVEERAIPVDRRGPQPPPGPARPPGPVAGPPQFPVPPVNPTPPVAGQAQSPTKPIQPVAGPPRPTPEQARPMAGPPRPSANPAQPVAGQAQAPADQARPTAQQAQSSAQQAQPSAQQAQSSAQQAQSSAQQAQSSAQQAQPSAQQAQPSVEPTHPVAGSAPSSANPIRPVAGPAQPPAAGPTGRRVTDEVPANPAQNPDTAGAPAGSAQPPAATSGGAADKTSVDSDRTPNAADQARPSTAGPDKPPANQDKPPVPPAGPAEKPVPAGKPDAGPRAPGEGSAAEPARPGGAEPALTKPEPPAAQPEQPSDQPKPDADTTQVIGDVGSTQVIQRAVVTAAGQPPGPGGPVGPGGPHASLPPMVTLPRDTPMQGHEVFAVAADGTGGNRNRVLVALGALVVIAGLVWWLAFSGDPGDRQQAAPPAVQVGDPATITLPGTPDPRSGTMSLSQAQSANVFSAREVGLLSAVGVNAVTYVGSYEGTTAYLVQAFPNSDAAAAATTTTGVLDANRKLSFADKEVEGLPPAARAVGTQGPKSSLARAVYTAGTWTVQVSVLQSPSGDPAVLDEQLRTLVETVGKTLPVT